MWSGWLATLSTETTRPSGYASIAPANSGRRPEFMLIARSQSKSRLMDHSEGGAMKTEAVVCVSAVAFGFCASIFLAPPAEADTQCPYPGVGVLNANVAGIAGGFCDFPTEINGSHWHCQGGSVGLGLAGTGVGVGSNATLGVGGVGQGAGGVSCNWRCPDGTDAPAPNPPGAWKQYLVPMDSTNYCNDHMEPNGFWSAPTLPTEGIPPAGEMAPQPGETPPPQPVPPPPPTQPLPAPEVPPTAPGEPNP
jgi:hypothetical protein